MFGRWPILLGGGVEGGGGGGNDSKLYFREPATISRRSRAQTAQKSQQVCTNHSNMQLEERAKT